MDPESLKLILGTGGVAALSTTAAWALWRRCNDLTDKMIDSKGSTTEAAIKMADALKAAVDAFRGARP